MGALFRGESFPSSTFVRGLFGTSREEVDDRRVELENFSYTFHITAAEQKAFVRLISELQYTQFSIRPTATPG